MLCYIGKGYSGKKEWLMREEKLLANQQVIKTPVVRNGKQASVGYAPEVWKSWV